MPPSTDKSRPQPLNRPAPQSCGAMPPADAPMNIPSQMNNFCIVRKCIASGGEIQLS